MSELADLVGTLVAIDSVNPDLVPGAAGEGEIARFVAEWLERAGLAVQTEETAAGRPNVIGTVRGTGGGRSLMLNAHLDTVAPGAMERPFEPRVDGDRLSGLGAFDMKASLAAIMLAGAELARTPPRGDVILTAVTDEEYASIGTAAIVRDYRADAALLTEPTDLEVCLAHRGSVWAEIETHGVAAHGAQAEVGVDAIAKMGRVLVGLDELDRALRAGEAHPRVGTGSVHASLIEGGIGLSTYPDRCLLQLARRTIPGESAETVEDELRRIVAAAGEGDPAFRADVRMRLIRDHYEIEEEHPFVEVVRRQARAIAGEDRITTGPTGWMDSALLGAAGIPTVIYGPRGDGAHAAVEWVDLPSVEVCRRVYAGIAREFCG